MKITKKIMGMPVTVDVVDETAKEENLTEIFEYFEKVDKKFSTYKADSEITKINKGLLGRDNFSAEMAEIFRLSEQTKQQTRGYFDIEMAKNIYDPSGLVKGWAIFNAANLLARRGFANFYVEAGGDIQAVGHNQAGEKWKVGIRNPFNKSEIVKVVYLSDRGMATSGSYERGAHIYNPHQPQKKISDIVSLTVIGPNIYEADRFATAAFAMGQDGINFIEKLAGLEGYIINKDGIASQTSGFGEYLSTDHS